MVVVDRFSNSSPLAGLPTALQVAEALFQQVVRYYGLPANIVSDHGPQFTSRVWKAFMERLGSVSHLGTGLQRAGGEDQPRAGEVHKESLSGPAGGVGPVPSMGGIRLELTLTLLHWADSRPLRPSHILTSGHIV